VISAQIPRRIAIPVKSGRVLGAIAVYVARSPAMWATRLERANAFVCHKAKVNRAWGPQGR
jgi:hypothetical protein